LSFGESSESTVTLQMFKFDYAYDVGCITKTVKLQTQRPEGLTSTYLEHHPSRETCVDDMLDVFMTEDHRILNLRTVLARYWNHVYSSVG
jgi:hypothetical protein